MNDWVAWKHLRLETQQNTGKNLGQNRLNSGVLCASTVSTHHKVFSASTRPFMLVSTLKYGHSSLCNTSFSVARCSHCVNTARWRASSHVVDQRFRLSTWSTKVRQYVVRTFLQEKPQELRTFLGREVEPNARFSEFIRCCSSSRHTNRGCIQ